MVGIAEGGSSQCELRVRGVGEHEPRGGVADREVIKLRRYHELLLPQFIPCLLRATHAPTTTMRLLTPTTRNPASVDRNKAAIVIPEKLLGKRVLESHGECVILNVSPK